MADHTTAGADAGQLSLDDLEAPPEAPQSGPRQLRDEAGAIAQSAAENAQTFTAPPIGDPLVLKQASTPGNTPPAMQGGAFDHIQQLVPAIHAAAHVALGDLHAELPGVTLTEAEKDDLRDGLAGLIAVGIAHIGAHSDKLPQLAQQQVEALAKIKSVGKIELHDAELLAGRSVHRVFARAQDAMMGGLRHLLASAESALHIGKK